MNRRQLLRASALVPVAAVLSACNLVTTTTINGVTTITVNVASLDNWGKAIVSASGLIAPLAGPVGVTIAAIGTVAEADLAAVDKLTGGSVTLTFDQTSVPSAVSSLLADGQKILTDAAGIAPVNLTTVAQTYITALETVVNLFSAALGSMATAAASAKMSEAQALSVLGVK